MNKHLAVVDTVYE